jgi:hypothetical protein
MQKKYRVVLLGLMKSEEELKSGLSDLGLSPTLVETMIERAPAVLRGNLTLGEARAYADAVQEAGGRVNIQEDGLFVEPKRFGKTLEIKPFDQFTMCPECGQKQPKGEACVKCGLVFKETPV